MNISRYIFLILIYDPRAKNLCYLQQVGSDTCHQCAQSDVRQYKEQMNLMEQRNMTLQTKTERLDRELRVMGDRLKTLEARNKDLEAANREELVRI